MSLCPLAIMAWIRQGSCPACRRAQARSRQPELGVHLRPLKKQLCVIGAHSISQMGDWGSGRLGDCEFVPFPPSKLSPANNLLVSPRETQASPSLWILSPHNSAGPARLAPSLGPPRALLTAPPIPQCTPAGGACAVSAGPATRFVPFQWTELRNYFFF